MKAGKGGGLVSQGENEYVFRLDHMEHLEYWRSDFDTLDN